MGGKNAAKDRPTGLLPPYLIESLKSISVYSTVCGVTEVAGMDSIWDKKALKGFIHGANLPRQIGAVNYRLLAPGLEPQIFQGSPSSAWIQSLLL